MKKTKENKIREDSKAKKVKTHSPGEKSHKGEDSIKNWEELFNKEYSRNQALEKESQDYQKKLEENEEFTLRLRADFENYRKRVLEEKERFISYAGAEILKQFLKIYDNYTKALDVKVEDETTQAFLKGFKLIKQEMDKFLEEHKVTVSTQLGDDFDPNIHQAIFFEEVADGNKEKVMEIFQHGYLLNDRLLREAMVKVAKPVIPNSENDGEEKNRVEEDDNRSPQN